MMTYKILSKGLGLCVCCAAVFIFTAADLALAQDKDSKTTYKGQSKRDPFVPLITPAGYLVNLEPEKNPSLNLEGIMYDPKGDSIAIINGELVRVGDTIGDAVLASIEPAKVTIIQNNQRVELELRREE